MNTWHFNNGELIPTLAPGRAVLANKLDGIAYMLIPLVWRGSLNVYLLVLLRTLHQVWYKLCFALCVKSDSLFTIRFVFVSSSVTNLRERIPMLIQCSKEQNCTCIYMYLNLLCNTSFKMGTTLKAYGCIVLLTLQQWNWFWTGCEQYSWVKPYFTESKDSWGKSLK